MSSPALSGPRIRSDLRLGPENPRHQVRLDRHAGRRAFRQALRTASFRSNTTVVNGVMHVWSDDAYQALDCAEIGSATPG